VASSSFPAPHAAHHPADAAAWSALAHRVYDEVDARARGLDARQRARVARALVEEATRTGLDPRLVLAVIHVESSFDPTAVSRAGAVGLMQLLLPTMLQEVSRSRLPSADPLDPAANVRAGVSYLRRLLDAFGDVELALMAYNAGPNRISRFLREEGAVPERLLSYPRKVLGETRRVARRWDAAAAAARVARSWRDSCAPSSTAAPGPAGGALACAVASAQAHEARSEAARTPPAVELVVLDRHASRQRRRYTRAWPSSRAVSRTSSLARISSCSSRRRTRALAA
jgi:hypothetical protein